MTYEQIRYRRRARAILTITLDRPDKLNAFTTRMMHELIDAFDRADADDAVRVVIVTGAGRGFCAGADLSGGSGAFDHARRHAAAHDRRASRRRRPAHAAHLRVEEAGDRRDQRPRRRRRHHDDAADGRADRLQRGAHGLRVRPPRHRPRGVQQLVPAAPGRHQPRRGVGLHRTRLRRRRGARRRTREPRRRAGRGWSRPRAALAREMADGTSAMSVALSRQLLWRMLGADHPMEAHKVDSRCIFCDGPVGRRPRGRGVVPREAPAALLAPAERRHAGVLPVVARAPVQVMRMMPAIAH